MKSFFSSAAPAWCRFGAAAFVLVSLTNVASAVSVATNTFENPTLPLKVSVAHSGSGSFAQTTVVTTPGAGTAGTRGQEGGDDQGRSEGEP